MSQAPLVSILINNYNYGRYVGQAIDSALNQTYQKVEVIVVDDGSTDMSREVIASYGDRIIAILKENGGQTSALNAGFAASSGEWIHLLDSDDLFNPNKVQRISELAAQYPTAGMIAHDLEYCDASGEPIDFAPPYVGAQGLVDDRQLAHRGKLSVYLPATSGLSVRRDVLERILPIPEAIRVCTDNFLKWVTLSLFPVLMVTEFLAKQRIHGSNLYTIAAETGDATAKLRLAKVNATLTYHMKQEHPHLTKLAWKQYGCILYQLWSCRSEESRAIETEIRSQYSVMDLTPSCFAYVAAAFAKTAASDLLKLIDRLPNKLLVSLMVLGDIPVVKAIETTLHPEDLTPTSVCRQDKLRVPYSSQSPFGLTSQPGCYLERARARIRSFLMCERWAVGIVRAPIHTFLDPSFIPTVQWVGHCGPLEFLADCFGVIDGTSRFILAERFTYRGYSRTSVNGTSPLRKGRGYITSIAIDGNGNVLDEVPAIDTGLHMSFPYTLQDRGSWYCVAEEVSRSKVNLYKRAGTGRWEHVKELLSHAVIDPCVFYYSGQWWMFGTTPEQPLSELRIWYADQLEGDWQAHEGNPVRNELRNTRPAGTPFLSGGCLYRPTQNSTGRYGGSVVINRIDSLTRSSFEEHAVQEIHPLAGTPFLDGVHTLSAFGDWTLIDAKRYVVLPRVIIGKLLLKLSSYLAFRRKYDR